MAEACRVATRAPEFPVEQRELARVSGVITDLETGEAIDPNVLRFTYKLGEEDAVTLVYGTDAEVVREEAGVFHVDVPTEEAGVVRWRWETDGTHIGAAEGQVTVRSSGVL